MKKNNNFNKITLGLIFSFLIVSSFQMPLSAQAETLSESIGNQMPMVKLWENPNQSTENKFRLTAAGVLKSGIIQNVVGCTGVVNKISTWMLKFVQSPAKQAEELAAQVKKMRDLLESTCSTAKGATETAGGTVGIVNDLVSPIKEFFSKVKIKLDGTDVQACLDKVKATNDDEIKLLIKQTKAEEERNIRESCLDGIAITLAKNQLTKITHGAVNWINSGYGGNPFFVRNMTSLTNKLEQSVIERGLDQLQGTTMAYPYGNDLGKAVIESYSGGNLKNEASYLFDSFTSDIANFVSYKVYDNCENKRDSCIEEAGTDDTAYKICVDNYNLCVSGDSGTPLENSKQAIDVFSNDFSSGGWNAWLALTQKPQNNPLGFTMLSSQAISDRIAQTVSNTTSDLATNNGFLSQKQCVLWQLYDKTGKTLTEEIPYSETAASMTDEAGNKYQVKKTTGSNTYDPNLGELPGETTIVLVKPKYSKAKGDSGYDKCVRYENITPGSIIKEQTANYLNSPVRQLELAKTINESLNALFSVLISRLEQKGLAGLSDSATSVDWVNDTNSGDYSTWNDNTRNSAVYNGGAYGGVNLTRDLGNTYIHDKTYSLGTWNASTNTTTEVDGSTGKKLYPDLSPVKISDDGTATPLTNVYYTITTGGRTILINDGYNVWEIGDRAFWDGSTWQNWKCKEVNGVCTNQINPIKTRGIVQIQQDYLLAAKELLGILPNVMPALGELDYCLPGPNPSYKTNSDEAQTAYGSWVGTMQVLPMDQERKGWRMEGPGSRTYTDLVNIYKDDPYVWGWIYNGAAQLRWLIFTSGFIPGGYHYGKNSNFTDDERFDFDKHQYWADNSIDYATNHFFQNFYEIFDKMMDKYYFNNMTSEYLTHENTYAIEKNPAYIPMSQEGLEMTARIKDYNDEITSKIKEYQDNITQTKINISKLEPIKKEVSGIIKAAQDRRNEMLLQKLRKNRCDEEYKKCVGEIQVDTTGETTAYNFIKVAKAADTPACNTEYNTCLNTPISDAERAAFMSKYQECFDEENIKYYEADGIISMGNPDEERCSNKIDDDLDGLIDMKDPDCKNTNNGGGGTGTGGDTDNCVVKNEYGSNNEPINATLNGQCSDMNNDEVGCNNYTVYSEVEYQDGSIDYNAKECEWVVLPPKVIPSVSTPTAVEITYTSAKLRANLTAPSAQVSDRFFYYGTSPDIKPKVDPSVKYISAGGSTGTGIFTSPIITGLTPSTTYYFIGCATNIIGTGCTTNGSFKTPASSLVVPTVVYPQSSVTPTSIKLSGTLTNLGNPASIVERYFYYGTSPDPTTNKSVVTDYTGGQYSTGVFSKTITTIFSPGTYYYKACASNSFGAGCSSVNSFNVISTISPEAIPEDTTPEAASLKDKIINFLSKYLI